MAGIVEALNKANEDILRLKAARATERGAPAPAAGAPAPAAPDPTMDAVTKELDAIKQLEESRTKSIEAYNAAKGAVETAQALTPPDASKVTEAETKLKDVAKKTNDDLKRIKDDITKKTEAAEKAIGEAAMAGPPSSNELKALESLKALKESNKTQPGTTARVDINAIMETEIKAQAEIAKKYIDARQSVKDLDKKVKEVDAKNPAASAEEKTKARAELTLAQQHVIDVGAEITPELKKAKEKIGKATERGIKDIQQTPEANRTDEQKQDLADLLKIQEYNNKQPDNAATMDAEFHIRQQKEEEEEKARAAGHDPAAKPEGFRTGIPFLDAIIQIFEAIFSGKGIGEALHNAGNALFHHSPEAIINTTVNDAHLTPEDAELAKLKTASARAEAATHGERLDPKAAAEAAVKEVKELGGADPAAHKAAVHAEVQTERDKKLVRLVTREVALEMPPETTADKKQAEVNSRLTAIREKINESGTKPGQTPDQQTAAKEAALKAAVEVTGKSVAKLDNAADRNGDDAQKALFEEVKAGIKKAHPKMPAGKLKQEAAKEFKEVMEGMKDRIGEVGTLKATLEKLDTMLPPDTRKNAMEAYKASLVAVAAENPLITDKNAFVDRAMDMSKKQLANMTPAKIEAAAKANLDKAKVIKDRVAAKSAEPEIAAMEAEVTAAREKLNQDVIKLGTDLKAMDPGEIKKDGMAIVADRLALSGKMDKIAEALAGLDLKSMALSMGNGNTFTIGDVTAKSEPPPRKKDEPGAPPPPEKPVGPAL